MTFKEIIAEFKKNKFLYGMMIPTIIWILIFCYIPMTGIVIAFKDFSYMDGIFGSKWCGFKNFEFMFRSNAILNIAFNTIYLNVLFILFGTIMSVFLALMFVEIKNSYIKRITQSIAILPHFISWALVSIFLVAFLNDNGIVNGVIKAFGMDGINFYTNPNYWRSILVILKIWQGAGFGTVIYVAAITGLDAEMYEAAKIDGATRLQQITKITLPMLKSTIILLTIMSVGKIFNGDFGMIYALVGDNSFLYPTVDVIDTYVYRALRQLGDYGMSMAVSLFQSVIGLILVLLTNALVKKIEPESAML
jgi:putative aldouronate transport system permease protein